MNPLQAGTLKKHGYSHIVTLTVSQRRRALRKALAEFGYVTLMRKVNAVAVLNRNTHPRLARLFEADKKWLQTHFSK